MKKLILSIIFLLTVNSFAQNVIREFTNADYSKSMKSPLILAGEEGELLLFYQEDDSVFFSSSSNGGNSWQEKNFVTTILTLYEVKRFDGVKLGNGNLVLGVISSDSSLTTVVSMDNGATWVKNYPSEYKIVRGLKLSQIDDSTAWLAMDGFQLYETKNYGISWQEKEREEEPRGGIYRTFAKINNTIVAVYYKSNQIMSRLSNDGGLRWGPEFQIIDNDEYRYAPDLEKKGNKLYLSFISEKDGFSRFSQPERVSDLNYITSPDGIVWESDWWDINEITKFQGPNYKPNTSLVDGDLYTTFLSKRFNRTSIWYCKTENANDEITPPFIGKVKAPKEILNKREATILTNVYDESSRLSVHLQYKTKMEEYKEIEMYEDQEGFKCILPPIFNNDSVYIRVKAVDRQGYEVFSDLDTIVYKDKTFLNEYLLGINRFKLPINHKGKLADVRLQFPNYEMMDGGRFKNKVVLFSGGFGLSGINSEGTIWSNGVISSSRIESYLPGIIDTTENDQDTLIYVLDKNDPPFGDSWTNWKDAVKYGAYFYDGDGDGKYNPIDKNENNQWDENEDSPDLLGDITTWMVYNDSVDPSIRRYSNVSPQGIEVRQTTWAYDKVGALNNTIFIRYSLLNTGTVSEFQDSVYFSIWIDPDIGSVQSAYTDDLSGCDTTINAGYAYNDGYDNDFGTNPPSLFTQYLQGPIIKSSNPDAYAFNRKGRLGEESVKGYENLPLTSFMYYGSGVTGLDDPDTEFQLRNYLQGRSQFGELIDPCTFVLSEVVNYDCNLVNPKYIYSGDPIKNIGWLNNDPRDTRFFSNSGPFKLEKGKPVDIIIAYIIGDGESAINSIAVGREYAKQIQQFYENNFTHYVVSDVNEEETLIPTELSLSQNYPNPFNPTTVIEYSIPEKVKGEMAKGTFIPSGVEGENVKLVVYDVLGREVQTLVKKEHSPGNYKVIFPGHSGEGRNLSSGVYFYRLEYGTNIITRKMLLLK